MNVDRRAMIKSEPAGCPPFWFQSDDVAILGNKKQFVRTENGVDDKGGRKKSPFADLSSGEGGGAGSLTGQLML